MCGIRSVTFAEDLMEVRRNRSSRKLLHICQRPEDRRKDRRIFPMEVVATTLAGVSWNSMTF
jgi:hypothetical protein